MSLSELLYDVLTRNGSPVQIASIPKMHKAPISVSAMHVWNCSDFPVA
jgi:hypothetical protein